jgi:tetratricopeptide (TPR) repeat protein
MDRLIKTFRTLYLTWLFLGVCHRRTGSALEARKAFHRGLTLVGEEVARSPRSGYDRSFLAYFCAQLGEPARAESEAAQSLLLSPAQVGPGWMAALTYERLGRRDKALNVLASAPRDLLEDTRRWPEASSLVSDERFLALMASARTSER